MNLQNDPTWSPEIELRFHYTQTHQTGRLALGCLVVPNSLRNFSDSVSDYEIYVNKTQMRSGWTGVWIETTGGPQPTHDMSISIHLGTCLAAEDGHTRPKLINLSCHSWGKVLRTIWNTLPGTKKGIVVEIYGAGFVGSRMIYWVIKQSVVFSVNSFKTSCQTSIIVWEITIQSAAYKFISQVILGPLHKITN